MDMRFWSAEEWERSSVETIAAPTRISRANLRGLLRRRPPLDSGEGTMPWCQPARLAVSEVEGRRHYKDCYSSA